MIDASKELAIEIKRNKELIRNYEEIGAAGLCAKILIEVDIERAERAIVENDINQMLFSYRTLRGNQ